MREAYAVVATAVERSVMLVVYAVLFLSCCALVFIGFGGALRGRLRALWP